MLIHYISAAIKNKDIGTLATLQASTDMLYVGTGFIMVTKFLKERVMRCKAHFSCFQMVNLTTEGKGREGKGKGQHCLSCRPDQRGREWGDAQRFNPRDAPAQDRNHLLRFHNLSNSATSCGPDVQAHVPLGNISNANLNYQ